MNELKFESCDRRIALLKLIVKRNLSLRLQFKIGDKIQYICDMYGFEVVEVKAEKLRKIILKSKTEKEIYAALKKI